jgi:hypothetical protein
MKAQTACYYLPDYLWEETMGDSVEIEKEDMSEYRSTELFTDQVLQLFPREETLRMKMLPDIGDALFKLEEARMIQEKLKKEKED